ncbi:MAG: LacI family DNA-binding transcriptional regulator, partial [Butyricicoccus sp.]
MQKRVTIKDIAEEAGVSTGTVHRAIYGKKGVTEAVRQHILDICAQRGYRTNTAASALKRGTVRIAAAFPGPDKSNHFFYDHVWRGFRRYIAELADYNLEVVELPYYAGTVNDQAAELEACYERYGGEIDALITIGHFNAACRQVVQRYTDHGIPVFLACDDTPDCGRIACVQADYDITGRIVAELISSQLPAGSAVLLCAGDALIPSHFRT